MSDWGGWVSTAAVILEAEVYSISFWLEDTRTECPGFKKDTGF